MHATCYVRTIREIYITVLKSANYEAPNYVVFFCSASRWSLLVHCVFCYTFLLSGILSCFLLWEWETNCRAHKSKLYLIIVHIISVVTAMCLSVHRDLSACLQGRSSRSSIQASAVKKPVELKHTPHSFFIHCDTVGGYVMLLRLQ